ncbi:MAG: thioredoxin [Thermoplasmata archaeon]
MKKGGIKVNNIKELSDDEFSSFLEENKKVIIDFWATWCGPCKMVKPTFEDLAKNYNGKISFAEMNIEENNRTANQYGVQAIPAFLFFENGQVVGQVQGALPPNQFVDKIEESFNL